MVYTNRTEKCTTSQESNTVKTTSSGSQYRTSFGVNSNLNSNSSMPISNSWSKNAADTDKWKYNKMVRDDRDKFNGMHFC